MELTDEQLVSKVRSGETVAYSQLFEKYQSDIYNYSHAIVRNTEEAQDIAQNAFIKVFEALPRLKGDLNFSAYLYRTARNMALDEIKAKKKFGSSDVLDTEEEKNIYVDPQRASLLDEQQVQVRKVAAGLPDDFREALTLRELQDMSYEQISSIMDIPKNTVGVLLMRARLKFKQEFRMAQVSPKQLSKECKEMLPLLSAYVDNELTEPEKKNVKGHLEDCPLCRLALEEITEASKSYRAIIPLVPAAILREAVFSEMGWADTLSSSISDQTMIKSGSKLAEMPGPAMASKATKAKSTGIFSAKTILIALVSLAILSGGVLGGNYWLNVSNDRDNGAAFKSRKSSSRFKKQRPSQKDDEESVPLSGEIEAAPEETQEPSGPEGIDGQTQPDPEPQPEERSPAPTPEAPVTPALPEETATPEVDNIPPPTPSPVSPGNGALVYDTDITLEWSTVSDPSGVSYSLEIQAFINDQFWQQVSTAQGLKSPNYAHILGNWQERWRVWAIDGAGNISSKTNWSSVQLY